MFIYMHMYSSFVATDRCVLMCDVGCCMRWCGFHE